VSALRVVIVDDSITFRAMLEQVISRDTACEVVGVAADVPSALELMQSRQPDAITLDLAMPGVDGLQFLRALKGKQHPAILVVSSSTKDGSWERAEALAAGAAACFDKAKLMTHLPQLVRTLKKSAHTHRTGPVPVWGAGRCASNRNMCASAGHTDHALLYVSRQALAPGCRDQAISKIVDVARARNVPKALTGALVCTSDHFAQLVEGPSAAVADLLRRIEQDDRHTDLTVLRMSAIAQRELPNWSMAYSGPSSYVAQQIEPLIGEIGELHPARVDRLHRLLVGLAKIDAA
jgi:two-component system chemotaxis response regulator CheB